MSTFGGDGWLSDSLHRKRRVDDLLGGEIEQDQVRRLSNGRLACLVCPTYPVFDTLLMLHVHRKGTPHQAATGKQQEEKKRLHEELQKRIAIGSGAVLSTVSSSFMGSGMRKKTAPLLTATQKIKSAVLRDQIDGVNEKKSSFDKGVRPYVKKKGDMFFEHETKNSGSTMECDDHACSVSPAERNNQLCLKVVKSKPESCFKHRRLNGPKVDLAHQLALQELQKGRERELRLFEAGWRRDGCGGWVRDQNVEFDSDEEVPSDSL